MMQKLVIFTLILFCSCSNAFLPPVELQSNRMQIPITNLGNEKYSFGPYESRNYIVLNVNQIEKKNLWVKKYEYADHFEYKIFDNTNSVVSNVSCDFEYSIKRSHGKLSGGVAYSDNRFGSQLNCDIENASSVWKLNIETDNAFDRKLELGKLSDGDGNLYELDFDVQSTKKEALFYKSSGFVVNRSGKSIGALDLYENKKLYLKIGLEQTEIDEIFSMIPALIRWYSGLSKFESPDD